jgi:hypothetical protein
MTIVAAMNAMSGSGARIAPTSKAQSVIRHVADMVSGGLPTSALRVDPHAARHPQMNLEQANTSEWRSEQ